VGDFNGDGRLDVVVANNRSHDVSVLINNTASQSPAPPTPCRAARITHSARWTRRPRFPLEDIDWTRQIDLETPSCAGTLWFWQS